LLTQTFLTLMIAAGSAALHEGGELARNAGERTAEAGRWLQGHGLDVRFAPAERAVTNWRLQTATALEPTPVAAFAALVQADRPVVTRCVKLNNYWCIKSARWEGELGTDDEGHVGFASAERGADAAAVLLRRYYLEFGRKSAFDVVRRWAPAECNLTLGAGAGAIAIGPLAVRGIGGTVRARWLASRRKVRITAQAPKPPAGGGGTATLAGTSGPPGPTSPANKPGAANPRQAPPRVSAVIARAVPTFRVPEVAASARDGGGLTISSSLPYRMTPPRAGRPRQPAPRPAPPRAPDVTASLGEGRGLTIASSLPYRVAPPPRPAAPARTAGAPQTTASLAPAPPPAAPVACASDDQRLRNYAVRIAEGLGLGPNDDLKLFEADGTPTANLAPVLLAMSAFELGTLRASGELVEGAVERQAARARVLAQQAGPIPVER
jgi:hypothetical protein